MGSVNVLVGQLVVFLGLTSQHVEIRCLYKTLRMIFFLNPRICPIEWLQLFKEKDKRKDANVSAVPAKNDTVSATTKEIPAMKNVPV